jgi:predicted Fe-Mo cluster-binding NifX family protein
MLPSKILIPLYENDVAPRFDLATEALIVTDLDQPGSIRKKMVVLPRASAEKLCQLIITEGVQAVICSGIEEDYYQYLTWKRIEVVDSVIGSSQLALDRFIAGKLKSGDILP